MTVPDLKAAFSVATIPQTMQLIDAIFITDVKKCIDSHIALLESNPGKKNYLPFYNRLVMIAQKLK